MRKIYDWYINLPKRVKDSVIISTTFVGMLSTILSVLGISLADCTDAGVWFRFGMVVLIFILINLCVYNVLGKIFRDAVNVVIRKNHITIKCGNIFETSALRVIGCDSNFNTTVDDIIIAKSSLHGQLVLEYGSKKEIDEVVAEEARRRGIQKNSKGLYDFPLGTIIRYDSSIDNHTYLMLAMTELNEQYEAHTNMAEYENMLMKMWKEIDRVYALNDVALPILGTGISRFDDGPKDREDLLRCMLCTLNSSGVTLKSNIEIYIYGDAKNIQLYEYKDMFRTIKRR